jgi:UDP-N-acetylglucosamine 2-epimerase
MVAGHLFAIHFAPTKSSKENLLRENISKDYTHVTGNTVINALWKQLGRILILTYIQRNGGMGVGPQQHIKIIHKMLKFSVRYGLKWPFSGPKTYF